MAFQFKVAIWSSVSFDIFPPVLITDMLLWLCVWLVGNVIPCRHALINACKCQVCMVHALSHCSGEFACPASSLLWVIVKPVMITLSSLTITDSGMSQWRLEPVWVNETWEAFLRFLRRGNFLILSFSISVSLSFLPLSSLSSHTFCDELTAILSPWG